MRFGPPPPMMIGGRGVWTGLGRAGESTSWYSEPSKPNVSPSGVSHSPVMIASCSSRRSKRSFTEPKGMP